MCVCPAPPAPPLEKWRLKEAAKPKCLYYQFEQREPILDKKPKYVGRLEEDKSYFNKICLYGILSALKPHLWW